MALYIVTEDTSLLSTVSPSENNGPIRLIDVICDSHPPESVSF